MDKKRLRAELDKLSHTQLVQIVMDFDPHIWHFMGENQAFYIGLSPSFAEMLYTEDLAALQATIKRGKEQLASYQSELKERQSFWKKRKKK